jgi:hypothetical protein
MSMILFPKKRRKIIENLGILCLIYSVYEKYFVIVAKRKKKMGRPPKKAKDVRSKPVTLRMTPADHKQLLKDARDSGLSVSAYLKACWKKMRN